MSAPRVLALCGGVGGAKLVRGLAGCLAGTDLAVAVNVGDDFRHLGLHVSADLDTVIYTLAGRSDPERGWGRAAETWRFMDALAELGGPDWFRLGDTDLALHVLRTRRLEAGEPLSSVTADVAARLGVTATVTPVTDDPVRTILTCEGEDLSFQEYFVRRRAMPVVSAVEYRFAHVARMAATVERALAGPGLEAIVLCPSNPILSIGPILAIPSVRAALAARRVPCIAVAPIRAGIAFKGPTVRNLVELGVDPTPRGIAGLYAGLIDGFVLDEADAAAAGSIADARVAPHVTSVAMPDRAAEDRLAREVVAFAGTLGRRR